MDRAFSKVAVIGLGYIGLPTAAVLAGRGVEVVGVDVNPAVIRTLAAGDIHIVEPELDVVVRAAVQGKRLRPVLAPEPAEAFVIAVPTPFKEGHKPDLAYVEAAARSIAPVLAPGNLVILESTSPVGATQMLCGWLAAARPDLVFPHETGREPNVAVAYCPERVLPGRAMHELIENDRVIGGMTPACGARARALYEIFVSGTCLVTDARTAELVKLTENAFRDVNIAFANELSLVCDALDIDVWELIRLANRHPRVKILQPGPGVGGHCIAIDPWFIVDAVPERTPLMRTAREVNDGKPHYVVERILARTAGRADCAVACLGLSFKADIDDLRESPAVDIVSELARRHPGPLLVAEPHVTALPEPLRGRENVRLVPAEEALAAADVVALLVNHRQFAPLRELARGKPVIDTRGMWQ
jgi:UDP-N-acetyl-D-mannosaminuronic acid dehydrogenase